MMNRMGRVAIGFLIGTSLLAGCVSNRNNGGGGSGSGNTASGTEDKPATTPSQLGSPILTKLAAHARNVRDLRSLVNFEYTADSKTTGLRVAVINVSTSAKCDKVGYYFTWSELSPDNHVINETATTQIPVAQGRRYLLRLYSTALTARCSASVTYQVTGATAEDLGDALLIWPKMNYHSFGLISLNDQAGAINASIDLQMANGVSADSSDFVLSATLNTKVLGGSWSSQSLLNIDGSTEVVKAVQGVLTATCTGSDGTAQEVTVGSASSERVLVTKQVLSNTGTCATTPRLVSLKRIEHGLVELTMSSTKFTSVKATLVPTQGPAY